ncbi:hypothetical protein MUP46_04670 [Patescibacteria group bacterium]|nr:hypothetical protein [Patescibacteria group bacterium]
MIGAFNLPSRAPITGTAGFGVLNHKIGTQTYKIDSIERQLTRAEEATNTWQRELGMERGVVAPLLPPTWSRHGARDASRETHEWLT